MIEPSFTLLWYKLKISALDIKADDPMLYLVFSVSFLKSFSRKTLLENFESI